MKQGKRKGIKVKDEKEQEKEALKLRRTKKLRKGFVIGSE